MRRFALLSCTFRRIACIQLYLGTCHKSPFGKTAKTTIAGSLNYYPIELIGTYEAIIKNSISVENITHITYMYSKIEKPLKLANNKYKPYIATYYKLCVKNYLHVKKQYTIMLQFYLIHFSQKFSLLNSSCFKNVRCPPTR